MIADVNSASITYEESKELAAHPDAAVRAQLARRADLRPEVLYFLAEDGDAEVRRAVAENTAAPGLSNKLLATDADHSVRTELASKIAAVAPDLDAEEADRAKRATYEALEVLARDQMVVVRGVLSEALKDIPDAPHEIIKRLANDIEIEVSGPVLENSPVLNDEDLLEIIAETKTEGAVSAVARRDGLGEMLSDAIVETNDTDAIANLLGNNSAQIREETLDQLVDEASNQTLWHQPLVARRTLPDGAAARMAKYLADNLLSELSQRADLDEETLAEVKSTVAKRIGHIPENGSSGGQDFLTGDVPMDMAMRLYNARKLDPRVIEKALGANDHGFVFAALLIRAGVGIEVGRRIFTEKHGKAIMGLSWKAGLSAEMGEQIQKRMGRLAPEEVIEAKADGTYPLSDHDLAWQVEFFANIVSGRY